EAGKRILDQATASLKKMNDLEEQSGKLALLNSNNKAAELWRGEGQPAANELDSMLDAMIVELNKGASESQRNVTALLTARLDAARLSRAIVAAYTSTNLQESDADVKEALRRLGAVKADLAKVGGDQAVGGLNAQLERLAKATEKAAN